MLRSAKSWLPLTVLALVFAGTLRILPAASAAEHLQDASPLESLVDRARSAGSARVIVELDVVVEPEEMLPTPDAVLEQRERIRRAQARLIDGLSGHHAIPVREYQRLPYLALELDEAGIAAAAADPEVIAIHEDQLMRATLMDSTVLIGATNANGDGFGGGGHAVVVLDTGVDPTHPFLAGRVVHQACFSSTVAQFGATTLCPNGLDTQIGGDAGSPCAVSGCDHGTHVAGIAVGEGVDSDGVAPGAELVAVQVFSRFTDPVCADFGLTSPCVLTFTSDQLAALEHVYAERTSIDIAAVNMSFGGDRRTAACDDHPLRSAIEMLRAAEIATVVASGNDGYLDAIGAPACISSAISVGSTTKLGNVSSFSNSAPMLDLLAPGSNIESSIPGGGFASFSGTSMAAPHVAGAFAVIRSAKRSATVEEMLAALVSTGVPILDPGNNLTTPRIQVDAAVDEIRAIFASEGELAVTPRVDLVALGPRGGPFESDSQSYTLSNPGTDAIDFSVDPGAHWIEATPRSGTLSPGSQATVTVSLGPLAAGLAFGDYVASTAFTNTSNGVGSTSRSVFLTVTDVATNDDLASSITLPAPSGTTAGSNLGATTEPGEPEKGDELGGRSVSGGRVTSSGSAEDYFPLAPGIVWNYLVNNSYEITSWALDGVQVNGVLTTPIYSNNGVTEYYTVDDVQGVRLHRGDGRDLSSGVTGSLVFSPAIPISEGQVEVGQVVNGSGKVRVDLGRDGVYELSYRSTAAVEAEEVVAVPLGTYDTLRVRTYVRVFGAILGRGIEIRQVDRLWVAKDVGAVKRTSDVNGVTSVFALSGFTPPPQIDSLTSDLPAPQLVGTTVTFTADVSGGSGNYELRWWLFNGARWFDLTGWQSANTFTWTPTSASDSYKIGVWVRNAGHPVGAQDTAIVDFPVVAPPPPQIDSLSSDLPAPQLAGTTITFTADVSGGSGNYELRWWLFNGARWFDVTGWQSANTFTWTPSAASDDYQVGVWVRNVGHPGDAAQDIAIVAFPVEAPPPPQIDSLTSDLPAPQPVGTTVTFTADVSGGSSSYELRWWLFNGARWFDVTGWQGANTFTWTPASASDDYQVGVWVRNVGHPGDAAQDIAIIAYPIDTL